jgi:hypothetical protein
MEEVCSHTLNVNDNRQPVGTWYVVNDVSVQQDQVWIMDRLNYTRWSVVWMNKSVSIQKEPGSRLCGSFIHTYSIEWVQVFGFLQPTDPTCLFQPFNHHAHTCPFQKLRF